LKPKASVTEVSATQRAAPSLLDQLLDAPALAGALPQSAQMGLGLGGADLGHACSPDWPKTRRLLDMTQAEPTWPRRSTLRESVR
jgi:hypothetical protein